MSNFQVIDLIFAILLGLLIIRGYVRGFITELLSWAGLVLGILAAVFFHPAGAAYIRTKTMEDVRFVPEILAFIGIFLIVMLVSKILKRMLKDVVTGSNLGKLDKILGAAFGFAEGIAAASLVLFVLSVLQPIFTGLKPLIDDSIFAQILLPHLNKIPLDKGKEIIDTAMRAPSVSWQKYFWV